MIGIRGIIRRAASKVVASAVRSPVDLRHHVSSSVKANNIHCWKPFNRLFSSSLHNSPKFSSQELFLRGMGVKDEVEVDEHEKVIRFAIEERGNKQALVLTPVLAKGEGEISNVEVHVSDVDIGEHGDVETANQSGNIPFVIRGYDNGAHLEMQCTCYPDKICVDHLRFDKDPLVSCNQIDMDMLANLVKTYRMHLNAEAIKPSTIFCLRELMLELNEFKKCFAKKLEECLRWSFFSSVLDYACRRRFDFKNVCSFENGCSAPSDDDQDFSDDNDLWQDGSIDNGLYEDPVCKPREHPSRLIHVMTRKGKDETICIEEVDAVISDFGETCNRRLIRFIFSLLNDKGTCLQFRCFAYPGGKISIDTLEIIDDWKFKDIVVDDGIDTNLLDDKGISHILDLDRKNRPLRTPRVVTLFSESMFAT